jgi:hypothetical protein
MGMQGLLTIFEEGGAAMFFILGVGFATLGTAFWFAVRPTALQVGFIKWMSRSLIFGTVASVFYDIATVLHVAARAADDTTRVRIVLQGASESCAPAILGGALLALVALLAAVGQRRLDARKP